MTISVSKIYKMTKTIETMILDYSSHWTILEDLDLTLCYSLINWSMTYNI